MKAPAPGHNKGLIHRLVAQVTRQETDDHLSCSGSEQREAPRHACGRYLTASSHGAWLPRAESIGWWHAQNARQVLWDQYLCLGNDALAAGAMQVCKTLPDKHPDFSTLCLLWPDVVLLYLPALCSLSHLSPQLFFFLFCSLRQLPCAFPSLSLVNQTPLPQAPKPCIAARLYTGQANFFPARETELSCFSRVFHQCKGRDRCKRQPRLESHAPVSRFLLESLCSAVHSGASQPM